VRQTQNRHSQREPRKRKIGSRRGGNARKKKKNPGGVVWAREKDQGEGGHEGHAGQKFLRESTLRNVGGGPGR